MHSTTKLTEIKLYKKIYTSNIGNDKPDIGIDKPDNEICDVIFCCVELLNVAS